MPDSTKRWSGGRAWAIAALILTPLIWPLGAAMIWSSAAWNRRDKLIGTLLPPGGYLPVWLLDTLFRTPCQIPPAGQYTCPAAPLHYGPPEVVHVVGGLVLIVLIALPIVTTIYMGFRLRQRWGLLRSVSTESLL